MAIFRLFNYPKRKSYCSCLRQGPFFWYVYNEEEWPLGLFSSKFFNYSTVGVIILRWKMTPVILRGSLFLFKSVLRRWRMKSHNGIQLTYYLVVISTQCNFLSKRSMNYTKSSPENSFIVFISCWFIQKSLKSNERQRVNTKTQI